MEIGLVVPPELFTTYYILQFAAVIVVVENIDSTEWKQYQVVDNADYDRMNILYNMKLHFQNKFFCQKLIQTTLLLILKLIT